MAWSPPDASRDQAMVERSPRSPDATITESRRYVITSSADLVALRDCALEGAPAQSPVAVVDALTGFATTLYRLPPIAGVAFLTSRQRRGSPHGPTTLAIEILQPVNPENRDAAEAFQAAILAKAQLSEQLAAVLPCVMGVVNTEEKPLDVLEPGLWRRWRDDPSLNLLAFLIFQRA
jgi:hypothetical protein